MKTKTLPFSPKKKPLPKETKKLSDDAIFRLLRKVNLYSVASVSTDEMPGCCGMHVISNLGKHTALQQAAWLLHSFEDNETFLTDDDGNETDELESGIGMIILTDVVGSSNWAATKAVATKMGGQGLVVKNPNSGNDITHWSVTRAMIPAIYRLGLKK